MTLELDKYYVVDALGKAIEGPFETQRQAEAKLTLRVGQRIACVRIHPLSRKPFLKHQFKDIKTIKPGFDHQWRGRSPHS